MNLKTVFSELATALNNDSDISSFLSTNYGVSTIGRINIGTDPEDYPVISETTAIYLLPGSRSRTRGDAYRQHNISVICLVNAETTAETGEEPTEPTNDDDTETETSQTDDEPVSTNIEKIDALGLLDEFTNLVEKCVFDKLQSLRLAVTPLSGESDELYYPIAVSELAYSIEIPSRI